MRMIDYIVKNALLTTGTAARFSRVHHTGFTMVLMASFFDDAAVI